MPETSQVVEQGFRRATLQVAWPLLDAVRNGDGVAKISVS
jgi:hypothetical protein